MLIAACLYFKHVRCLQRSVCTVRILRRQAVPATLVIGVRTSPFASHAWVEIGGRILNESVKYQQRLTVLYTS